MDSETSWQHATEFYEQVFGEFERLIDDSAKRWIADAERWRGFVRGWVLDGYARRDVDVLVSMVTEDFTNVDPLNLGHVVRGPEGFRRMLEDTFVAFPDTVFAAAGMPSMGLESDTIVVPWRTTGTFIGPLAWGPPGARKAFSPTGNRFDFTGVDTYQLRGHKVCAMRSFYDPIEVAQQLGFTPPMNGALMKLMPWPQSVMARFQRAIPR